MNCKVCYEKYTKEERKPLTLMPCGHSLCELCLSELKKQVIVFCPSCRNPVCSDKPNYDLIDMLDLKDKNTEMTKIDIKKSINKQLKEFKDQFNQFCTISRSKMQESRDRKELIKETINLAAESWIKMVRTNQQELLDKAENLHKNLNQQINTLMEEQISKELTPKNLKLMDLNELIEFKIDLNKLKNDLNHNLERLNELNTNHEIQSIEDLLIVKKKDVDIESPILVIEKKDSTNQTMETDLCVRVESVIERVSLGNQEIESKLMQTVPDKEKIEKEDLSHSELVPLLLNDTLITALSDSSIKIWNIRDQSCINVTSADHSTLVTCLQVISKEWLVSGSEDKTIKVWNIKTGELVRTLTGHTSAIECILKICNSRIVSGAGVGDRTARIFNIDTGECDQTLLDVDKGGVYSLCFQNGSTDVLISGGGSGTIKVLCLKTGALIKTLKGHVTRVNLLQVLQSDVLVSSSEDKIIKIWNIQSGQAINILKFCNEYFHRCIQVTSKGVILSASDDITIKVWCIGKGECVKTLEGHTNIVLCIQLVTDTILCSGSWDNTIKVWNLDTNTCIKTLHGHQDRVYCIRVLSRSVIISASHDKTIKVWNINTGEMINSLDVNTNDLKFLQTIE